MTTTQTDLRAGIRACLAAGDYTTAADAWWRHLWDEYELADLMFRSSIEANRVSARGAASAAQVRLAEFNAARLTDAEAAVRGLVAGWSP